MKNKQKKKHEPCAVSLEESANKNGFEETIRKLEEKLVAEREKAKGYLDELKYLQADFDNYRKRMQKVVQGAIQKSNERLVACLIDVIDDLENAISAGETTDNKEALIEGIRMVHKKLDKLLEKEGLERIECVGQPFDPNIHEVLAEVPTREHQSGTVLEEARKGFMFKGKVLRPSIVKIACEDLIGDKK